MLKSNSYDRTQLTQLIFGVLSLSMLFSCAPIIKTIYGIKQPKFTDDDKIANFAKRLAFEQEILRLKGFDMQPISDFKRVSLPEVRAYSPNGKRLLFEKTCTTDFQRLNAMTVDELAHLSVNDNENLNNWIAHTYGLEREIVPQPDNSRPKYAVVFATYLYLGRLNKINTKPGIDSLALGNDLEFFVLNVDITEGKSTSHHADVQ